MTEEELREIEERAKGAKEKSNIKDLVKQIEAAHKEGITDASRRIYGSGLQAILESLNDNERLIEEIRRLREENEELKSSHYNLTGKKWDEEQEQWKKEKERAIKQSREAHQMLKPKP